MKPIRDDNGDDVTAGSMICFSFGIPPVVVNAKVIERDGKLIALTPGHNPKECSARSLRKHVGSFYLIPQHLNAALRRQGQGDKG